MTLLTIELSVRIHYTNRSESVAEEKVDCHTVVGDIILPMSQLPAKSFIQLVKNQASTQALRNVWNYPFSEECTHF
jgi:hypothetical protein